jgi:hypothetical protein
MSMIKSLVKVLTPLGVVLALLAGAGTAIADEVKTPVSASILLNILAPRAVEGREAAYDASLKEAGRPARSGDGELQADGTVRYGSVTVTVRNPCPPGTEHYDPRPLPGRRARN